MEVNKRRFKKLTHNNFINVDELNAYKIAYGNPLNGKDYSKYIGLPALGFGILSFVLLYTWWISLICTFFGALYGAKVFMPMTLKKRYDQEAFMQRNKFINNTTQSLSDKNTTVKEAIKIAMYHANGKFEDHLMQFYALIHDGSKEDVYQAVTEITEEYRHDIVFNMYMKQIETGIIQGKQDLKAFKDVAQFHEFVKNGREEFALKKMRHLSGMKQVCSIMFMAILVLNNFPSFQEYLTVFARAPIGMISAFFFLLWFSINLKNFFNEYFDDEIMEVPLK